MHETLDEPLQEQGLPKISEISIAIVDNGFVIRVHGQAVHKNYVIQAESNKPEEIENVLDVVRNIYHQVMGGKI